MRIPVNLETFPMMLKVGPVIHRTIFNHVPFGSIVSWIYNEQTSKD